MSNKRHIPWIVLSVFILLIAPYIPHHHHEGIPCLVERCEQDSGSGHDYIEHQESLPKPVTATLCIENVQYLTAKSDQKHPASSGHYFIPSADLAPLNRALSSDIDVRTQLLYSAYIIHDLSTEVISSNGLRAPPFTLV